MRFLRFSSSPTYAFKTRCCCCCCCYSLINFFILSKSHHLESLGQRKKISLKTKSSLDNLSSSQVFLIASWAARRVLFSFDEFLFSFGDYARVKRMSSTSSARWGGHASGQFEISGCLSSNPAVMRMFAGGVTRGGVGIVIRWQQWRYDNWPPDNSLTSYEGEYSYQLHDKWSWVLTANG